LRAGKSELQARRNEKLAQRNPARIQQQIDDLKALKESGGKLTGNEEQALEALEKDLKAVKKAREALGDNAPQFGHGGPRQGQRGGDGVLGKRRRDADDASSSDSDVPADVKSIPMPRDTPPPIPKEVLDEWFAKRRAKRNANHTPQGQQRQTSEKGEKGEKAAKAPAPAIEVKTVYEAQPMVRNLQKEAVSAFMPAAVRMKIEKGKGQGGLLEPEEADQLEREGYLRAPGLARPQSDQVQPGPSAHAHQATVEEAEDDED